ncbi:tyrosine-type recombinase/integrase [Algoriphagus pacificus]|uniref:Tyrosine-type recombinase/integrase n=1 Tax=Algoriphagus pacificus TaxID=2811234 RepID=A0ABS3CJK9_9BACT|nr:tyrosine-type recombinase/integrase [Algoriphagus pacificus]
MNQEEVKAILQSIDCLRRWAELMLIFSAGLRISKAVKLRIRNIHSDEGYIFIIGSKGEKDQKTLLFLFCLELLRQYYKPYKPSYWLFEGQGGWTIFFYKYSGIISNSLFFKIFLSKVIGLRSTVYSQ